MEPYIARINVNPLKIRHRIEHLFSNGIELIVQWCIIVPHKAIENIPPA